MPALVSEAELITPAWLTEVLHASGAAPPEARVHSFTHNRIGTGKLGDMIRFELTWVGGDGADLPPTLVGKFASTDPTSRQAGLVTGIYAREISFYQEVATRVAMRIPHCHFADLDMETGEFALILEDIAPATQGSQVAGCSVDQAALAMDEAARLHASLWGATDLRGRTWLNPRAENGGEGLATMYAAFVDQFLIQYDDRLSDQARAAARRFTPVVSAWLCTDREPLTLLHGDYRLENMLFGAGPGAPALCTVDWQTVSLGAGPSDVAYFLGAGLLTPERRQHERELVERYRAGLASGGVELGADEVWESYRANTFAGLHMAVVASVLVARSDHGDDMFLAMAERHAAHIDDLDAWELVGG